MSRCEHFQSQLLDHLYGLLEADESLALIEHAGQCEDCREALLKADVHKKLLGAAAKPEFPGLHFSVPADDQQPAVVPMTPQRTPSRRLPLRRWAAAAAILLAVCGIAVPGGVYLNGHHQAYQAYQRSESEVDRITQAELTLLKSHNDEETRRAVAFREAKQHAEQLLNDQKQELKAAHEAIFKRNMVMVVKGPQTIRVGEETVYTIETRSIGADPNLGPPVPVKLDAAVRDVTTNRIVYEQKNIESNGSTQLALAPDIALSGGTGLALELVAHSQDGARGELKERLTLARASYVTHLATDKPIYQPGEMVYWRSLTLDRFTLKPPTEDLVLSFTLTDPRGTAILRDVRQAPRVVDSNGKEMLGPDQKPIRGVGIGSFGIPEDFPGGEYILEVKELSDRFPTERRKFIVNRYQKPRLNKKVLFEGKAYGPGSEVVATGEVERVEGGMPLAAREVRALVRIDGIPYQANGLPAQSDAQAKFLLITDARGKVTIRFTLPTNIERGDATLSVEFTDGANFEALSKPIPIVLKKMQLELFPEGGDLVAGVPNRVYFAARTMLDRAATVKAAVLLDETGKVVLEDIHTFSDPKQPKLDQGMGQFVFTPQAGKRYELQVLEPMGIEQKYRLPDVAADGVVLHVARGVSNDQQAIEAVVTSAGRDRDLLVGVYCRGRLLNYQEVTAKAGAATTITLKPAKDMGGVYRVTVFEKVKAAGNRPQLLPAAERLIYRRPTERLQIAIDPDKTRYQPGEKAKLHVKVNNEAGLPAPTMLLLSVVDQSVITMADERTARTMPAHFLLTSEVRKAEDLEFADVLLHDDLQAPIALDLLLGTQGWRRFLESDPTRMPGKDRKLNAEEMRCSTSDVDRLMVAMGQLKIDPQQAVNTFDLRQRQIMEKYGPLYEDAEAQLVRTEEAWRDVRVGQQFESDKRALRAEFETARQERLATLAVLQDYDAWTTAIRSQLLLAFGVILLLAAGASLLMAVTQNLPRALPVFGAAVAAVAVCGLLLLGTFLFEAPTPEANQVASVAQDWKISRKNENAAPIAQPTDDKRPQEGADPRQAEMPAPKAERAGEAPGAGGGVQRGNGFGNPKPEPKNAPQLAEQENKAPGANAADAGHPQAKGKMAAPVAPAAPPAARDLTKAATARAALQQQAGQERGEKQQQPQREERAKEGKEAADAKKRKADEVDGRLAGAAAPFADAPQPQNGLDRNAGAGFRRQAELRNRAYQNNLEELRKLKDADKDLSIGAAEKALNDRLRQDKELARQIAFPPAVFRQYAHVHGGPDLESRADFAETLYWHPVLVLPDGKAEVSFDLCDSVTRFEVTAYGHGTDGRLGAGRAEFEAKKPFNLSAQLPIEVTANDVITVPVVVDNASEDARKIELTLQPTDLKVVGGDNGLAPIRFTLQPHEKRRVVYRLQPAIKSGNAILKIKGISEPFGSDLVQYVINVVPEGFPITGQFSDILEKVARHDMAIPEAKDLVKGTLKAQVQVYPSRLSDLQSGLEGLLREPNGCFEQTSTSNYPNVLILGYLQETKQLTADIDQNVRGKLERGYRKLTSFECLPNGAPQRQGYEWFGGAAPAHEALTAYGLLQFRDMQRVGYQVDPAMVDRTRKYLMAQKDGLGGFKRNPRALDTFGRAPREVTDAYIVWAITESELGTQAREDLDKEIDALKKLAQDKDARWSQDPYFLALVANSLVNRNDALALELLKKLGALQKPEGFLDGSLTSITGSGGRTLQIEATALAVMAWLKANRPVELRPHLDPAIKWISQQRGGHGAFGSTQSTILALKALLAYTRANNSKPVQAGELALSINGTESKRIPFDAGLRETLTLDIPEPEKTLKAGANLVEVELTNGNVLPYTLTWTYQALKPVSAEGTPIRLQTKLDHNQVKDGTTLHLKVTVENTEKKSQGMVVAVVGLPAGLELPTNFEQLKDYVRLRKNDKGEDVAGPIDAFEVMGRELRLYWRQMLPEQTIAVDLDLICRIPGEYRGPASRAYLYYNADVKHWIDPVEVKIAAQGE